MKQRFLSKCSGALFETSGQSASIQGAFSSWGWTKLVKIQKQTRSLKFYMKIWCRLHCKKHNWLLKFIFRGDNFHPHCAKCMALCMQQPCIDRMQWPVRRPDFNIIENIWRLTKTVLRQTPTDTQNLDDLFAALQKFGIHYGITISKAICFYDQSNWQCRSFKGWRYELFMWVNNEKLE